MIKMHHAIVHIAQCVHITLKLQGILLLFCLYISLNDSIDENGSWLWTFFENIMFQVKFNINFIQSFLLRKHNTCIVL